MIVMNDQYDEFLYGWKQIAHHLKVSARTAQKWARYGMPVHHLQNMKKGPVGVLTSELNQWSSQRSRRASIRECRKPARKAITVRLSASDYERMKMHLSHAEAATVQDLMLRAVADYLKRTETLN